MLIHACILERGVEHKRPFANLLLQMYATCGAHDDAHALFALMPIRDVISWNAMLALHTQCGHATQALQLFQHMHWHDVLPNRATFLIALSACDSHVVCDEGRHLHCCIVQENMESDVVVGTALVSMYGRCHSLEDAWEMFTKMLDRDIVAWNAMIAAYAQNGHVDDGLQLFHLLDIDSLIPNKVTFLTILDVCGSHAGLDEGKRLHSRVLFSSFAFDIAVGNALINMYNKCGNVKDAREMFDNMHERNVVSWTSIIAAFVQHGFSKNALQSLHQMQLECVLPNKVTLISILPACASMLALVEGIKVHALVVGCDVESHNVIGNALVYMYGKCSRVDLAQSMFARMRDRDAVSWNAMIAADSQHSLQLFQQMYMEAFIPNKATFVAVLTACTAQTSSLAIAKRLHAHTVGSGLDADVVVVTSLVTMYGKCGTVEEAQIIMDNLSKHDVIMCNAIIAAFTQNGYTKEALQLLYQCQMEGLMPDKATFVSILDACGNQASITEGKQVHVFITGIGIETDTVVGNALLTMYGKCGRLEEAEKIFQKLATRDVVTWNAMIVALGQCGQPSKALQHFEEMQTEGIVPDKVTFVSLVSVYANEEALLEGTRMHARIIGSVMNSDIVVQNALVNMYGKCGSIEEAKNAFDIICKPDTVSWNALIAAHAQCGQGKEALGLYHLMQPGGVIPDKITLISTLSAFASEAALVEGKHLHACIVDIGLQSDVSVGNALVNMYGKCGSLEDARHVFERMEKHDIVSWNAMIATYAQHGQAKVAFELFHKIESNSLIPDKVTLVSILVACSHAGLVDEGCWFFLSMVKGYGIKRTIDHYNCMVDLLGRAGQLHELENLMKCMPMDPTYASWMTFLSACKKHFDLERGELAANRVMDLQPQKSAPFVLLSNIYAGAGKWDDATKVREVMRSH